MAVFTEVDEAGLRDWLGENYGLPLDGAPEPITEGIENTNYRISCGGERYIFTILEVWDHGMARFCAGLAHHLASAGARVPPIAATSGGGIVATHSGKPATVTSFIDGSARLQPDADSCARMGAAIAELHLAAVGYAGGLPNKRGAAWRRETARRLRPALGADDASLLESALAAHDSYEAADLPRAACHCDLFRNNVLWHGGEISGIIDFYFAGVDTMAFDLAVAGIDWCMDDGGMLDLERLAAMLGSYQGVRPLGAAERRWLPQAFAAGALRFWLSRMLDLAEPREASELVAHNPEAFRARLRTVLEREGELARLA